MSSFSTCFRKALAFAALGWAIEAKAQASSPLSLQSALERTRQWSPAVRGGRAAIAAASARERQAMAWSNPSVSWGREGTSRQGQANAQQIVQLELPLDVTGVRQARALVAGYRRQTEERKLEGLLSALDHETAEAMLDAVAANSQVQQWAGTRAIFERAEQIIGRRLTAGDVSGLAARRLRLEAARMAAGAATATAAARGARLRLATRLGIDPRVGDTLTLPDGMARLAGQIADLFSLASAPADSLVAMALRQRVETRVAVLEIELAAAERTLLERERRPVPVVSAGAKVEKVADPMQGSLAGFRGLVAGVTMPLPVLDRRSASLEASAADGARVRAVAEEWQRRVGGEVLEAAATLEAARQHEAILAPHMGADAEAALRAVQVAFEEGEATLLEWLDAVRAWHEASITWNTLQADAARARLRLARATGTPLLPPTTAKR